MDWFLYGTYWCHSTIWSSVSCPTFIRLWQLIATNFFDRAASLIPILKLDDDSKLPLNVSKSVVCVWESCEGLETCPGCIRCFSPMCSLDESPTDVSDAVRWLTPISLRMENPKTGLLFMAALLQRKGNYHKVNMNFVIMMENIVI